MKRTKIRVGFGFFLILALAAGSFGSQYKVVGEKGDFYFGHVSYVFTKEGGNPPSVFRSGAAAPETAILNLPLGPGDIIQTSDSGRCEVQFDTGTIVRLDLNTKLKIETVLAQTLSTTQKVTNLLLAQGQLYVMYKKYNSLEIFQVITPPASVKLDDNAVVLIDVSDGRAALQVEKGRARLLYGRDENGLDQEKVNAGARLAVGPDNIARPAEYAASFEFKDWNAKVNANFPALHEGNVLPKPLQKLPPAVFEFAQKFGNLNGEWIWHDLYGYVWRPYLNDLRYPWGTWQPYFYGNWSDYNGQLYWVPAEPWGWVPYHLGLWMWDEKSGWVWMPGSLFAPAWVDWEFYFGDYFWRPFTLFDYYDWWDSDLYYWAALTGGPAVGGPIITPPGSPLPTRPVRHVVTKDSLKQKTQPPFPVPKEMKASLRAAAEALKRGDGRVQASLRETLRRSVIISKTEFGKPGWQAKTVSLDRFLGRPDVGRNEQKSFTRVPSEFVARDAVRRYETARAAFRAAPGNTVPADFRFGRERPESRPEARIQDSGRDGARVAAGGRVSSPVSSGRGAAEISGIRFRDWNPDVRAAVRLGVDLDYSSRTNEVYSSRLGLRSRDVMPHPGLSPGMPGFSSGPGSSLGAGSGSAQSSTPGSSSPSSASSSASSGSRGSSKDGGGGKQN